jgi:hypothetical protein
MLVPVAAAMPVRAVRLMMGLGALVMLALAARPITAGRGPWSICMHIRQEIRPHLVANAVTANKTHRDTRKGDRHKNVEARRAYMRDYMRKRRARPGNPPQASLPKPASASTARWPRRQDPLPSSPAIRRPRRGLSTRISLQITTELVAG